MLCWDVTKYFAFIQSTTRCKFRVVVWGINFFKRTRVLTLRHKPDPLPLRCPAERKELPTASSTQPWHHRSPSRRPVVGRLPGATLRARRRQVYPAGAGAPPAPVRFSPERGRLTAWRRELTSRLLPAVRHLVGQHQRPRRADRRGPPLLPPLPGDPAGDPGRVDGRHHPLCDRPRGEPAPPTRRAPARPGACGLCGGRGRRNSLLLPLPVPGLGHGHGHVTTSCEGRRRPGDRARWTTGNVVSSR